MRRGVLAVVLAISGCGRLGFDPLGIGGNDAGGGGDAGGDGGIGIITTPFLDCDGIDDGVHVLLSGLQSARTYELRARVAFPKTAGLGEHELITVSRASSPGRLDGFRVIAETGSGQVGPNITTRLEMFETLNGNTVTGVAGPLDVEASWTHFAMVYVAASSKFQTFRDGVLISTPLTLTLQGIDSFDLCGDASGRRIAAEIDWVRISLNPRYTSAFTPTVAPPPLDANTLSLLDFDAGTVTDLVGNSSVTTSGGVLVGQP